MANSAARGECRLTARRRLKQPSWDLVALWRTPYIEYVILKRRREIMSEDMHVLVLIAEAIHKANFADPSPTPGVKDAHHKSKEGGSVDLARAVVAALRAAGYQIAKAEK